MHDIFVVKTNNLDKQILKQFPHAKTVDYSADRVELFKCVAEQTVTEHAWIVSSDCDYSDFDFDYTPPWHQIDQLHVWATENQTLGGDTVLINAREFLKQADSIDAPQNYQDVCWKEISVSQSIKPEIFVWSRGNDIDIPGAQTLRYIGNHLEMMRKTIRRAATPYIWIVSDELDYSNFNFDWRPGWAAEKYLHVWPTENQTLGGDTFYVNVEEFVEQQEIESLDHYQTIQWHEQSIPQVAKPEIFIWNKGNSDHIKQLYPDATVLRYIGSKFDMMQKTVRKSTTPYIWVLSGNCDYTDFDTTWRPGWAIQEQLHVWPTENQTHGGDTFYINTVEFKKQSLEIEKLNDYRVVNWHKNSVKEINKPGVVIWNNSKNQNNLEKLKNQFPDAIVMRKIGDRFDMLCKTIQRCNDSNIWIISNDCDYENFDFNWRPDWATEKYLHVWPTENQTKGGDTFYVDVAEFKKQCLEISGVEEYNSILWHSQKVKQAQPLDVVIWDNGKNSGNLEYLKSHFPGAKVLRSVGSRFDMMQRTMRHVNSSHVWIINSKCSYTDFDFSWRPDWSTEKHLHVWPTENQIKGGDTFYVDVAEFQKQCLEIEKLEYYDAVTWHEQSISLTSEIDVIVWSYGGNQNNLDEIKQIYPNAKTLRYIGTHLEMLKKSVKYTDSEYFWVIGDCCDYSDFTTNWKPDWETENSIHCWASGDQAFGDTFYVPRAQFLKEADNLEKLEYYSSIVWHDDGYRRLPWPVNYLESGDIYHAIKNHRFNSVYEYFVAPGSELGSTVDPSLWEKRRLIAYNRNGHVSLCPRDIISGISERLYDYPYIQYHNCEKSTEKPQDIVFISYDEKDADLNYDLLLKRFPQAKRIHGVKGNVMAYKEAAKISDTPWYYAVFPKTKIDSEFNFDIHPNYLETPGHYIFYAKNIITNNFYGHGGVKMYHVKTTIEIENWGYDFTLSSPVSVIPVNSCYIEPADAYEAWRTSFREVLKLKDDTTVEGRYRLNLWLTGNHAAFGEYSIQGAKDALNFDGDVTIANSWEWLRDQFNSRYN